MLRKAKGQGTGTEGKRDPMTSAVLTCVHAGRRVPQGREHCGKGGGADKRNHRHRQRASSAEQVGGGGTGRSSRAEEGPQVAGKKKSQLTRSGKGTGTGAGARKKSPQQIKKETNHPNERGRERSDPC